MDLNIDYRWILLLVIGGLILAAVIRKSFAARTAGARCDASGAGGELAASGSGCAHGGTDGGGVCH